MFDDLDIEKVFSKAKEYLSDQEDSAAKKTLKITVGGGMVNVAINGKMEVLSIEIDREVVDPDDIETLEDLMRSAMNEAIRQARELSITELTKKLPKGLKLPGFNSK